MTLGLEGRCSIQLSYGQFDLLRATNQYPFGAGQSGGRGGGIRTPDILLPKQARYRTALRPERPRIMPECMLAGQFQLEGLPLYLRKYPFPLTGQCVAP